MRYRIETVIRRPLALLLVSLLIAATTYAENASTTGGLQKNSLVKGAWALQFEISGNFDLQSFQGSTISLKKHTSDGSAWRIGLDLRINLDDRERTSERDGEVLSQYDYGTNAESISLILQRVFYPSPMASVNLFWGFGPKAGFSHYNYTREVEAIINKSGDEVFQWSVGFSGVIGIEWFPMKSISLLAEYGSVLQYEWTESKRKTLITRPGEGTVLSVDKDKVKAFSLTSSSVKFGLSVYF